MAALDRCGLPIADLLDNWLATSRILCLWSTPKEPEESPYSIYKLPTVYIILYILLLKKINTMKFVTSILLLSSLVVGHAFGVSPATSTVTRTITNGNPKVTPALRQKDNHAFTSPLFRDASKVRGGAVPGWAAYNDALDKKPLVTKAMTSLVGWALGDVLAQIFISGGPFDVKRFITLSVFGLIYHGPSGHYFYNWLDEKVPGTEAKTVAMKVAIDQLIWCPIFMTVFFTYLGLVNGDSIATIVNKIKADLFTAVQGSWKVWPIVHAVNFKFISTKHRLVFINTVQVAFNMFLSLIGSKSA